MKYIKGIIALAIVIGAVLGLCSCGVSDKTLVEKTIGAVSKANFDELDRLTAAGSEENVRTMREYFSRLDDEKVSAYVLLMKNIEIVSYRDENKYGAGASDTAVTFRLRHINFDELLRDVATENSVEGTPTAEIISKICASEKINGYIVYDDVTASIVRAGRRGYVEFDRNSELSGVLGATAFLRWLSSH